MNISIKHLFIRHLFAKHLSRVVMLVALVGGLGACSQFPNLSGLLAPTATPEVTPTAAPTPSPSPTPSPPATSVSGVMTLELWVPDFLNLQEENDAGRALNRQISAFSNTYRDTRVRVSVKQDEGLGGLYSLLSTAAEVAPSVVPDLIVLNQHDLIAAAEEGLIEPVDDLISPDADYYETALSAVRTPKGLWAFPYIATADQMAYRQGITDTAPLSWTAVLTTGYTMLFPAGATDGLASNALLAMYMGSGGRVTDQTGQATLDRASLERVYGFFDDMKTAGLLDAEQALGYWNASACWSAYQEGAGDLTPVSIGQFWSEPFPDTLPAWIPTQEGAPVTVMKTWGLAIVTQDPARREAALLLARWLVDARHMAEVTYAARMVPTRVRAFEDWGLGVEDQTFVNTLLSNSIQALPPNVNATVRRALQTGLVALLQGDAETPEVAASTALTSLRR